MASAYYNEKKETRSPQGGVAGVYEQITHKKNRKPVLIAAGIVAALFFWTTLPGLSGSGVSGDPLGMEASMCERGGCRSPTVAFLLDLQYPTRPGPPQRLS